MLMTTNGPRPVRRPLAQPRHAVLALSLVLFVGACQEKKAPPRPTPVVAVTKATRGLLPYVVNSPGQVEPARTVNVQSQVSGMLTRVAFTEGDEVNEGQVLFEVDPRPFRAELARVMSNLARDSANLAQANGVVKRYAALAKDGYMTGEQMDQVTATASALVATVSADKASVDAARVAVDQSVIKAPITGRTGILAFKAGNLVRASDRSGAGHDQRSTTGDGEALQFRNVTSAELRNRAGVNASARRTGHSAPARSSDSTKGHSRASSRSSTIRSINPLVHGEHSKRALKITDGALWPGQFVNVGLAIVGRLAMQSPFLRKPW